jgi:hypothetical protein
MAPRAEPLISSDARASGALNGHELRRYCRRMMPNVYLDDRIRPTLRQRTAAAWLWSHRQGAESG